MPEQSTQQASAARAQALDAIIIGAGFGGMYALHLLRGLGLSARVYDDATSVGGTWSWNRYPGARVDFPGGPYYCYTFSEELVREWDWAETQPDQPAVLAYLNFVADKFDLRRDIELQTRVTSAQYDEAAQRWTVETNHGARVSAQFLICAVGTLSAANRPNIPGLDSFAGACYHTGHWPHKKVDFTGKRVGIIGTGSSGVQAIPIIAREAAHLTVFQRTPQYTIPAGNRPLDPAVARQTRDNWPQVRQQMIESPFGAPFVPSTRSALDDTPEQRKALYETHWQKGGLGIAFDSYHDILFEQAANHTLADFVRSKIGQIVRDPTIAKKLMPDYLIGTKRQILDSGYYETFNRANVTLVDLRDDPIQAITPGGVRTRSGEHALDMLVLATGYDAITGALQNLNPRGRGGVTLKQQWAERFNTYLGMAIPGFPNLFMIHGPETPSVLFNMPLGAELEGEWIRDCIRYLREHRLGVIEPAPGVEIAWGEEVAEAASHTLFPLTESWYTGANIPGKHRQFAVHMGGPRYFQQLSQVAAKGYEGFVLEPEQAASVSA
ncbi:flavin-containing monooxygenase [Immundisolibacter sp.]|uniref:flavin-containing monooxygenase n=1 Tax=Immundisolibacter sp. TaxID=1934948 RepID=UPI003569E8D1